MSLKPLPRRRDSRATEHSERPDGLPMADKSKMETLAATVVVPPSVPSIGPTGLGDPSARPLDLLVVADAIRLFGRRACRYGSHLNYGDDAVINRPNENDRAGNLVREEAMILELGQVTIKQARYRIKRR